MMERKKEKKAPGATIFLGKTGCLREYLFLLKKKKNTFATLNTQRKLLCSRKQGREFFPRNSACNRHFVRNLTQRIRTRDPYPLAINNTQVVGRQTYSITEVYGSLWWKIWNSLQHLISYTYIEIAEELVSEELPPDFMAKWLARQCAPKEIQKQYQMICVVNILVWDDKVAPPEGWK